MRDYRPGEVVLLAFPFADAMGAKRDTVYFSDVTRAFCQRSMGKMPMLRHWSHSALPQPAIKQCCHVLDFDLCAQAGGAFFEVDEAGRASDSYHVGAKLECLANAL